LQENFVDSLALYQEIAPEGSEDLKRRVTEDLDRNRSALVHHIGLYGHPEAN
jgi:hypothetical protein